MVRASLISTGVGALVVLVGFLIAAFSDLGSTVKGSESNFTKYKAVVVGVFDTLISLVKDYLKFMWQVTTFDWAGAVETASKAGQNAAGAYSAGKAGVFAEARRAEIKAEAEHTERYIDVIKSRGEDTLALEVANSKRKIDAEKQGSKEQLDAVRDYLVLKNQYLKRQADEEKAQALARLEGLSAIEAANGREVIKQQRAILQEKLIQQIQADELAGRTESAARTQILAEMQALEDAHSKEVRDKRQAAELAALDARISARAAKGEEAFALEVARAERELAFLRSAAQRDEAAIIAAEAHKNDLVAARAHELTQRRHALRLAELDAIISLENTKGQESYADQVRREETALAYMKQAGTRNFAAEVAQQAKIDNLKAAHALKVDAEERAADLARLNARIAFLQAQGEDTIALQLQLKGKELAALLTAATQNEAKIIAKQGEIDALQEQQRIQVEEKRRAREVENFENEISLLEQQGKDVLALRIKFAREEVARDTDTSEKGLARRRADNQKLKELEQEMATRKPNFGNYLLKLLGVSDEDLPLVKQRINDAVATLSQSVGGVVDSLLSEGLSAADAAIQAAQTRLSELNKQLSDVSSKRQADEQALAAATGARRDYLISHINAQRTAEQKLAAEKAKAARDEEQAQKTKAKLDKEQQQISAASTAIESVLLAIKAAEAVVEAGHKGKFGYDNIALTIAMAAAVGASIFSVRNAVKQFEAGTGALGSDGVLHGPSHKQGGIGLFSRYGHFYGEAESGEAISPADASRRNAGALALIRTEGRRRTLTPADFAAIANVRVLPPSSGYYAGGTGALGPISGGGNYASAADVSALVATQQRTNALLSKLVESNATAASAAAATAKHTDAIRAYGPPRLEFGHEAEQKRRRLSDDMDDAEARARL